jgi:hypothetical protein
MVRNTRVSEPEGNSSKNFKSSLLSILILLIGTSNNFRITLFTSAIDDTYIWDNL